ncbi:transcription initiation factor IIB [Nitrosarchaeum sp.]|nr:transcription initiation factor IIB [Nitrosarchaeum sp.]
MITDDITGEIACSTCGVVFPEKSLETRLENSGFTDDGYLNSRVGGRISLKMADRGLSTIIEAQNRDSTGKILSRQNQILFYRLRMWDRNSRSTKSSQSFKKAFTLLDGLRVKLGLPDSVVEQTAYWFRKISAKNVMKGRSTLVILCATAYIVCRLTNTPRTLHDIAYAGNVKTKHLQRIYRFLVRELDIHPIAYKPDEFVTRLAKAINLSEKTQRLAFSILSIAEKKGITSSKNPMSMAAAVVHLASLKNNEKVSQLKISEISGISAVTIRDRAKEIIKCVDGEI